MEGNRPYYGMVRRSRQRLSLGPEYEEALIDVSQRHNIMLLSVVEDATLAAEKQGAVVNAPAG
jgi:hypothetical protein